MIEAKPTKKTKFLFKRCRDGDPDPIRISFRLARDGVHVRSCRCGRPKFVVRMKRHPGLRQCNGRALSEHGPWVQCKSCGHWKNLV